MISGLSSSGIATAIRTAGRARETMDTMSRQIATGQRVSSVKDDGAAWARAAGLESQKVQAQVRSGFHTANLRQVAQAQMAVDDGTRSTFDRMAGLIRQAMTLPAGSSARQQLATEYAEELLTLDGMRTTTGPIDSGMGTQPDGHWGIQGPASDPVLAGRTIWTTLATSPEDNGWQATDPLSNGQPYGSANLTGGTQPQLEAALRTVERFRDATISGALMLNGRRLQWLDRVDDLSRREIDTLDTAIGSLTDADLGKASAARAQAETRQQLALATVRRAISAYSSFATGLLGNAQRTQRALA
jgi:flagellin-like hook-associated protein FlgL